MRRHRSTKVKRTPEPSSYAGTQARRLPWGGIVGRARSGHANAADSIHSFPDSARTIADTVSQSLEDVDHMYADKTLTCSDCRQEFVFTASEQEFFADRGFTEPRRCKTCRATRKAAGGGSSAGGGYSSGGGGGYSSGGGGGYSSGGGSRSGGGYSSGPREMFTATCSSCGKDAQVPFQPTSGKPVYCNDCFARRRG